MVVQEVDELVKEWKPEPLVPDKSAQAPRMTTPVIDKIAGTHATINGIADILHLASYNFWGLSGDPSVRVPGPTLQHTARCAFRCSLFLFTELLLPKLLATW